MHIPWLKLSVSSYLDVIWHILGKKTSSGFSSWFGFSSRVEHRANSPSEIITLNRPPLWALIIGINDYSNMTKLKGAVADADSMRQYLESELKVPANQIVNLRDKQATRTAIIKAFTNLRDNPKIKHQDPILIYYAGHGGEVPSKDEDKTQTLIPVDYVPEITHPIPDRTVAALINGIAKKHGNNITVIFDCCHSGSGTRGDEEESTIRGGELSANDVPGDLDVHILADTANQSTTGTRGLHHAKGFAQQDMASHVLLAACSANELAREDKSGGIPRGRFTVALLDLFKSIAPDQLTYADVLTKIPRINEQNPQCEGLHKNRIFFDSKVRPPTRRSYEVKFDDKSRKYTLEGGRAHGITDGAEFTLYKNKEDVPDTPLGVMVARDGKIQAFSTILGVVDAAPKGFGPICVAIQTKAGALEDLKLHVPLETEFLPVFEAIAREIDEAELNPCRIKLVDREEAKLEVVAVKKNQLAFNVLEKLAKDCGFTSMPHDFNSNVDDLHRILRAAAHYYFHLNLNHENIKMKNQIAIEFFALEEKDGGDGELARFPRGENMCRSGKIDYEVDESIQYGMKITNRTPWDLHFACFFFDHADLSITALTEVNSQTQYQKDYPLKQGATAQIGYGDLGIPPFDCDIPDGLDLTVGFLKFYFTSEVVDLSHVPQVTPFSATRGMKKAMDRRNPVWGTVLIPVIQRRKL